ncbi:MAG TPA: tetratricopeptide repeat protein [Candidatus Binatia bacterium]|nr:tetratricopeptide repeat protein [Candidatus Binatia bacterium]
MSDSHLDRKDLKTPDAFFQGVGTANRFYHEHRIPMIVGTIAVVAFFLGIVSWRSSRHAAAESAAAAFLRATDAVEESSPESARSALQTVAESGATPYGALTGLYLAELDLKGGNADAAAEAYGRTAKQLDRDYLRQAAMVSQAFALETGGKSADAATAYATAANAATTYKEQALRGQLRTAKAANDTGLAKAALAALVESFPQSPDADRLSAELASLTE